MSSEDDAEESRPEWEEPQPETELYDDVLLEPEMTEGQLVSMEPPDVVLEGPTDEGNAPAALTEFYDSFTGSAHLVVPSRTRSSKFGGGQRSRVSL